LENSYFKIAYCSSGNVEVWNTTANLLLERLFNIFTTNQVRIDLKFTVLEFVKDTADSANLSYTDPESFAL
jgi:hypothetical protein